MKIAVMQPYFLPYIGYFQLIAAVDKFVFLDDVAFINRGWINRNQILLNGASQLFTIPLIGASQNRQICEIQVSDDVRWKTKLCRTIETAYRKAPQFERVYAGFCDLVNQTDQSIGQLAKQSVRWACDQLGIAVSWVDSSSQFGNANLKGSERIADICVRERATVYVNPPGGQQLYDPPYFQGLGVQLRFLQPHLKPYQQGASPFVPGLSILDVLMHNDATAAAAQARAGTLVEKHQLADIATRAPIP